MSYLSIKVSFGENMRAVDAFKNGVYILVNLYGLDTVIRADEMKSSNQRIISKDTDDFPTTANLHTVIHNSDNYYINVRLDNSNKKYLLNDIISTLIADTNFEVEVEVELYQQ